MCKCISGPLHMLSTNKNLKLVLIGNIQGWMKHVLFWVFFWLFFGHSSCSCSANHQTTAPSSNNCRISSRCYPVKDGSNQHVQLTQMPGGPLPAGAQTPQLTPGNNSITVCDVLDTPPQGNSSCFPSRLVVWYPPSMEKWRHSPLEREPWQEHHH